MEARLFQGGRAIVMELYFMLEEPSMKELLKTILPRVLPEGVQYYLIKHEGKQDLEKSLPRKLKAITQDARFVVVRDQDSADCHEVKQRLCAICSSSGRADTVVRIACREMESWFLGDLQAVEKAYNIGGLSRRQQQRKYRNPDGLNNAAQELRRLVPTYQKISGARAIGQHMDINNNCSVSFRVFIEGVYKVIG